jgi:hypothetical protein
MKEPEVVYDDAPTSGHRPHLFGRCFGRSDHTAAPAGGTFTTASVLTPMSFTSGFVGQGFALNGLSLQSFSPQSFGFGAQSYGAPGADFSDLHAAHDLELFAAQMAATQAVRDAQARVYNASLQRIRAQLNSISAGGVSGQKAETQAIGSESCCDQIKQQISDLQKSVESLDKQLKAVQKTCNELKKQQGK